MIPGSASFASAEQMAAASQQITDLQQRIADAELKLTNAAQIVERIDNEQKQHKSEIEEAKKETVKIVESLSFNDAAIRNELGSHFTTVNKERQDHDEQINLRMANLKIQIDEVVARATTEFNTVRAMSSPCTKSARMP